MTRDYNQLLTDIPSWLENSELAVAGAAAAVAVDCIADAEFRLARDLSVSNFEQTQAINVSGGGATFTRPANLLSPRLVSFTVSAVPTIIQFKELGLIFENMASPAGAPLYYGILDGQTYQVAPTPDQAYSGTLYFRAKPNPLNTSNVTNYFTTYAYDALKAACFAQAARYVLDDRQTSLINFWEGYYDTQVKALNGLEARVVRDEFRVPYIQSENLEGGR